MNLNMSNRDQQVAGRSSLSMEAYYKDPNSELQYKKGYLNLLVAAMLAKARREADCTDDLAAAAAKWKISDNPPQPTNPAKQPFKF